MYFIKIAAIVLATASLGLGSPLEQIEKRANCDNSACITYFSDGDCTRGLERGSYKPDCSGNCFQFDSFSSILIGASTIFGAGCVAYSDSNCQNKIADSGNTHSQTCMENLNRAKSMQCYYRC